MPVGGERVLYIGGVWRKLAGEMGGCRSSILLYRTGRICDWVKWARRGSQLEESRRMGCEDLHMARTQIHGKGEKGINGGWMDPWMMDDRLGSSAFGSSWTVRRELPFHPALGAACWGLIPIHPVLAARRGRQGRQGWLGTTRRISGSTNRRIHLSIALHMATRAQARATMDLSPTTNGSSYTSPTISQCMYDVLVVVSSGIHSIHSSSVQSMYLFLITVLVVLLARLGSIHKVCEVGT